MGRPRTVYRGKRKYGWVITLLVFLLVIALVASVWLFYYLQRFIVYDKDGLRLVLPYMDSYHSPAPVPGDGQSAPVPGVSADIVVDEKDYSDIVTGAGENLDDIKARRISASDLTAAAVNTASGDMGTYNALVLQLKGPDGLLRYKSSLPIADSYAVNGAEDISSAVSLASDRGIYMAAEISALEDSAMALRYSPASLKSSSTGTTYDADGQSWLDPYSDITRTYACDMMEELAGMGFKEIIFTGLTFPDGDGVAYSREMTGSPGPVGSIASFALCLREKADELEIKISAEIDTARLRSGALADIGQDAEIFFKVFGRVVISTDSYMLSGDIPLLEAALESDSSTRIVPRFQGEPLESGCCIIG